MSTNENADMNELLTTVLPLSGAVSNVFILAYVAYLVFEPPQPLFGAFVGLLVGIGNHQFLSFMLDRNDEERDDVTVSSTGPKRRRHGLHRGAVGAAIGPAGILLFAVRFVTSEPTQLLLAALGGALYAILSYQLFVRALPADVERDDG